MLMLRIEEAFLAVGIEALAGGATIPITNPILNLRPITLQGGLILLPNRVRGNGFPRVLVRRLLMYQARIHHLLPSRMNIIFDVSSLMEC